MNDLRRKLIKASAAVPAVLTVTHASATAKTSMTACLDRDAQKPRPYKVFESSMGADEWKRCKVDVCELTVWDKNKNGGKGGWVTLNGQRHFLGFDQTTYWKLDATSPDTAPAVITNYKKNVNVQKADKKGEKYCVMYFDGYGNHVGMAWEPRGGKHCTKSCWTSVYPKYG